MRLVATLACIMLGACAPKQQASEAEQIARGERSYQKCFSCHALEPGKNDLQGPTLHRVVGRSIAAEPGFGYSPAMRQFAEAERSWGKGLIDKFVADPEALVPGTSMTFHGISDADERKALIAYLERQTSASAANLP